jgi:hypothetical protein
MAAEQIAGALFEAEAAIDAALSKTARSPASCRRCAPRPAPRPDRPRRLERASQAIMALAEARRAIVETHKELSIAQGQVASARL